ncbi:MAG: protein kinase [Pseudomonadota bacterium]|nr:protein kinase [Pseudomonadota bacterium]
MNEKVTLGLMQTGVPGFDALLGGGLGEFSFNLIAGAPGSGKTTLAHQIMFNLANTKRRALFFTVLGEPPLKMLRFQQQYSFFDMAKVGPCIRYVNLAEDLRQGDFSGVLDRIMEEVEAFSPSLVFVDSFRSVVQTAKPGQEGVAALQYFIQELGTRMTSWEATTFLIGEYVQAETEANPIMTVADGVIALAQTHERNSVVRKIRVVKMRGQAHLAGSHTFRITGDGVRIYPRMLPVHPDLQGGTDADTDALRIATGTPDLDALLHGGLPQGHVALLGGPTGSGKTILGTRFLQEGARQGEKGVAMLFAKSTARLRNTDLASLVRQGHVKVIDSRSLDMSIEELLDDLNDAIESTGATRIFIDSLSEMGLYLAPEFRADLRLAVFRMLSALSSLGVSVLVTIGQEDKFTEMRFSREEMSFLVDAVIAMRYVEMPGRLAKVITVVKVRGVAHSTELREYRITDRGIEIEPHAIKQVGVLTGACVQCTPHA